MLKCNNLVGVIYVFKILNDAFFYKGSQLRLKIGIVVPCHIIRVDIRALLIDSDDDPMRFVKKKITIFSFFDATE